MKTTQLPTSRKKVATETKTNFTPKKILVPLEFGELFETSLSHAEMLATQFGSEVTLLHAVEPVIQPFEGIIIPPEMEEVNMSQLSHARERLEGARKNLKARGIECKAITQIGKPWSTIVECARKWKADLIVLPTHGRTWIKHVLLGSTAERVVQHAPCSVLVVR